MIPHAIKKNLILTSVAALLLAVASAPKPAHAMAIFETVPVDEIVKHIEQLTDKDTYVNGDHILFFEGSNCTENIVGSAVYDAGDGGVQHINAKKVSWFINDEARSVLIKGFRKNAVIVVYDNPHGHDNDDFAVIKIKKELRDKGVCIGTFERSFKSKDGAWEISYVSKNGLDGKVSHIVVSPKYHESAYPADVIFYEGNHCTQSVKAKYRSYAKIHDNCKHTKHCNNDEIRSVRLRDYGKSKYEIKVYDNPDGKTKDDWTKIDVTAAEFVGSVCVSTFEESHKGKGYHAHYHKHNGLDGKVSRIEIGSP